MTNEFDVLKRALAEHETAIKIKNLNQELAEYLIGSAYEIIKYCEENNIPLSKKEQLLKMIEKANFRIENIISTATKRSFEPHQPTGNTNNITDKVTGPALGFCQLESTSID